MLYIASRYNKVNGRKLLGMFMLFFLLGMSFGIIIPFVTPNSIGVVSEIVLIIIAIKTLATIILSYKHHMDKNINKVKIKKGYHPKVSILCPCYNEEITLKNCVKGLMDQTYGKIEIILINDGSKDKTKEIAESLAKSDKRIKVLNKSNGGKASALNMGIAHSKGEIIICIDGDTVFEPDTVKHIVASFADYKISVLCGSPRVANTTNMLTKIQSLEYYTGFNLEKRSMDELGCIQVVPGGISAFRKAKLLEIGGYSTDTIVEDMDVTLAIAKSGGIIAYNSNAIAYTEAPENLADFIKQRYRWYYGRYQALDKYKDMIGNKKYGRMGLFGLPYYLSIAWIDFMVSILTVLLLIEVVLHGQWINYLVLFAVFTAISISILIYVFSIDDSRGIWKFTPYLIVQTFFYVHLLNYINLRAWIDYKLGKSATWNKFARTGGNTLKQ